MDRFQKIDLHRFSVLTPVKHINAFRYGHTVDTVWGSYKCTKGNISNQFKIYFQDLHSLASPLAIITLEPHGRILYEEIRSA